MPQVKCPVCAHDGAESWTVFDNKGTSEYDCSVCGTFCMTMEACDHLPSYPEPTRRKVERYLYETRGESDRLLTSGPLPADSWSGRVLSLSATEKLYEDDGSPLEKDQRTIGRIAMQSTVFGHEFASAVDRWLVPTMDDNEADQILFALFNDGYITSDSIFSLTPKGLRYAAELGRQHKEQGTAVFVAACFDEDLAETREAISGILVELGYIPKQVNREPHNNLIDLEIFKLIRESRFVVADLTCNRPSVYYEVGFAHGLGLEVVLTCREDHFDDYSAELKHVHFDLGHRNILKWKVPADLAETLRGHIYQAFGAVASPQ